MKYYKIQLGIFFIALIIVNSCNMKKNEGGIIFYKTAELEKISDFYLDSVGCTLWLDQGGCRIFQHGNMLIGFCGGEEVEKEGVITFFYPEKERVDAAYKKFKDIADDPPRENPKYRIYHFYTEDPEGRVVEFQAFLHDLKAY